MVPKLKIKRSDGYPYEETREIEDARYLPFDYHAHRSVVVVEGQVVISYEELLKVVKQYPDKEFIEVVILPQVHAGG